MLRPSLQRFALLLLLPAAITAMADESRALLDSPMSISHASSPSMRSIGGRGRSRGASKAGDDSRTSRILTALNLMNGVIGAGIIGLPGALNRAGFLPGLLLSLFVALMSDTTIRLLAALGSAYGCATYEDLAIQAFGAYGFYVVCAFQGLFTFGAMCSYLLIFSDSLAGVVATLSPLPASHVLSDRRMLLVLGACAGMLPLSLYRHFGRLAKYSIIKFACMTALTCTVIAYFFIIRNASSTHDATWRYVSPHSGFFPAVGTVAFSFVCHHQTFLAYASLKKPSMQRFATVIHVAVGGAFVLSVLFAVFGYMTFWELTDGDIFNNYLTLPDVRASPLLCAARLLLALNMVFTYPGEMLVARNTLEAIIERRRKHLRWVAMRAPVHDTTALLALRAADEHAAAESADAWVPAQGCTRALGEHVVLTLTLFIASLAVALSTNDLNRVLDISGSFAAVFLAFVLPAAIRLRLGVTPDDTLPLLHINNVPAMCILAFGVFAFVTSTGFSLLALVTGADFMLGSDPPPSR